jgi:hypothetical protein
MIHPHTELRFINPELGFGVFATQFIPRGTITWVRDELDRVIPAGRLAGLPPAYRELLDRYTFRDDSGQHILCWDLGRFMNHSCDPSCLGPASDFEVAVRDIYPGEELTDDYGALYLQADESFTCRCGSRSCRGRVGPEDAGARGAVWEALLLPALALLGEVAQPLSGLLEARFRATAQGDDIDALGSIEDLLRRTVNGNKATGTASSEGGGIFSHNSALTLVASQVNGNKARPPLLTSSTGRDVPTARITTGCGSAPS